MIASKHTTTKLRSFTCKDAKLRRLLLWHDHYKHKGELSLCIPKHYRARLRVSVTDITKLRYKEKSELVHVLEAALLRLRKRNEEGKNASNKLKQQSITNYFYAVEPRK